jgi:hypothetical protein
MDDNRCTLPSLPGLPCMAKFQANKLQMRFANRCARMNCFASEIGRTWLSANFQI